MSTRFPHPGLLVLLAASALLLVLGSVHAFSVFLGPLETRFDAPRSLVSLTYSLNLVALTLAVLVGHRIFSRWPPARLGAPDNPALARIRGRGCRRIDGHRPRRGHRHFAWLHHCGPGRRQSSSRSAIWAEASPAAGWSTGCQS